MNDRLPTTPLRLLPCLLLATAAIAQCDPIWLPGTGANGCNGSVQATASWDPDGAGPATPVAVLGGTFNFAGSLPAQNIVAFDPTTGTWSALDSLLNSVEALLTTPSGDLIAGGSFPESVARYDGQSWQPIGFGFDGTVRALAVLPNGNIVAGGDFTGAFGFTAANYIARWNGNAWLPLGTGMDGPVLALAVLPNGQLIASGNFMVAGNQACNQIARWNGSSWSPLGAGLSGPSHSTRALAVLGNGDLVAGGGFTASGTTTLSRLARWNGSTWSSFGSGADSVVFDLHVASGGELFASGAFQNIDGVAASRIARWDGSNWAPLGGGCDSPVQTVTTLPNGLLIAGGQFSAADGVPAKSVARWNGNSWSAMHGGSDGSVIGLLRTRNDDLVACGWFTQLNGVPAKRVARSFGGLWQPLGSGMTHSMFNVQTNCAVELANGDLVVGGYFDMAGGVAANHIARWDGAAWHPLGSGLDSQVTALLLLPNGDLLVGGQFNTAGGITAPRIARWDGSNWHGLGSGITAAWYEFVDELVQLPGGDVIAAGKFTSAGGINTVNLARWDGSSWHAFGQPTSLVDRVSSLLVTSNGTLLVGGTFTNIGGVPANYLASWSGGAWSPFGALAFNSGSSVNTLLELPGGDVVVGGNRMPINASDRPALARWNGSAWHSMGDIVGFVSTLALTTDEELAVGGTFVDHPTQSLDFALIRSTCPAYSTSTGSGCTGSGGVNVLAADNAPWLGTTFRATATGLAQNGFAIGVFGFGTLSLPLANLLAEGLPGCSLLVQPDTLTLSLPTAGSTAFALPVPDSLAIVGANVHLQAVPVALAPNGSIAELSSSNALTITVGVW
ncbi:MAG: hypothetical protein R3F29_07765 [Planctomycetota bacterium]